MWLQSEEEIHELPAVVRKELEESWKAAASIIGVLRSYYLGSTDLAISSLLGGKAIRKYLVEDKSDWENDGNTPARGRGVCAYYLWQVEDEKCKPNPASVHSGYGSNCIAYSHQIQWRTRDTRINRGMCSQSLYFCGNYFTSGEVNQVRVQYSPGGLPLGPSAGFLTDLVILIDQHISFSRINRKIREIVAKDV
jgi:hypothetical protein